MSHRTQGADGLEQQRLVVEFARPRVEFTADHLVVEPHIARNADIVDGELFAFEYADLQVDRVFADDDFGRVDLRGEVALIFVEIGDGRFVRIVVGADAQALVHRFFVVNRAFFDTEHPSQFVGFIDRVADPGNIADVVLVAFRNVQRDTHTLVVDRVDRIGDDVGVAETFRIVKVEQQLLVVFEIFFVEFRPPEEVEAFLVGFLEGAAQTFVGKFFVACEIDLSDFDFTFAIDDEGHVYGLLQYRVVVDADRYFGVAETFVCVVFVNELRVLVDHVVRKLGAALEFELFEQVFLVAFGDALETPVIDAGTFLQENFQVEAVAFDGRTDADVRKEALVPQAGDGCRDEVAGQVYRIARDKTRRSSQNAVVNVLRPVNIDVGKVSGYRLRVSGLFRIAVKAGSYPRPDPSVRPGAEPPRRRAPARISGDRAAAGRPSVSEILCLDDSSCVV